MGSLLKEHFKSVPINPHSIDAIVDPIASYFTEYHRNTKYHIAIIGVENFGMEEVALVLSTILSPIFRSKGSTVNIMDERDAIPFRIGLFRERIRNTDEMIIVKNSGKTIYVENILSEIFQTIRRGIVISIFNTNDWSDWNPLITNDEYGTIQIELMPITFEQSKEFIHLLASFLNYNIEISDDALHTLYKYGFGYPQKIARLLILSIGQSFVLNSKTITKDVVVFASLFDD